MRPDVRALAAKEEGQMSKGEWVAKLQGSDNRGLHYISAGEIPIIYGLLPNRAAQIVREHNAHGPLVEALRKCKSACENSGPEYGWALLSDAAEAAADALRKAGEK